MRVFNLTSHDLDFHGVTIPSNGGSWEIPALDKFISNRDRAQEKNGTISFGKLPVGWKPKVAKPAAPPAEPKPAPKAEAKAEPKAEKKADAAPINFNPLTQDKPLSTGWVEKSIGKKSKE